MWNDVPMTLRTGNPSASLTMQGNVWKNGLVSYTNLPSFIQSRLPMYGTIDINTSKQNNLTLKTKMTAYMIRAPSWDAVELDGWTFLGTGPYLGNGNDYPAADLYEKIMDTGNYIINNYSAMYLFSKFLEGNTFKY